MAFAKIDVAKEIEKRCNESEEFRKSWEDSREEYKLIGEMIQLRKQKKITQAQLSVLTGSRQQVISRIEKKENTPSLGMFCRILDALGYELKIVKKAK